MFHVELLYLLGTIFDKQKPKTFLTAHRMEMIIPVPLLFCWIGAALC